MIEGIASRQAASIRRTALCCLMMLTLTGCLSGGGGGGGSTDSQTAVNRTSSLQAGPATTNTPPTISGWPASSTSVNQPYSFQPDATDNDGDALTFSILNQPAWASFDTATGLLSGTPSSAYSGEFSNIVISVTDGDAVVSLAAFTITVAADQSGSATLSWEPPTTNTDGSPLTDLTGYVIRYGTSPDDLATELRLDNPGLTTYVLTGLEPGTWYFQVAAFNSAGLESAPSTTVSKTVT